MGFNPQTGQWELDPEEIGMAAASARSGAGQYVPPMPSPDVDPAAIQQVVRDARAGTPPPSLGAPPTSPLALPQPTLTPARRQAERENTSTTTRRMGAEEKKTVQDLSASFDEQIAASQRSKELAVQQARDQDEAQQEIALFQAERAERRQKLIDAGETQLKAAMAEYKQQFDKYKGMEIKEFFSQKSTLENVLTGIAIGLGEFGKLAPGGRNVVLETVQNEVQADFARQRLAIDRQADVLARAERNADMVESFRDKALKNLDLKEAAALDAIEARWKSNLTALGVPRAEIEADATAAALRQGKALKLQSIFEGTRSVIQRNVETAMTTGGGAGGGLTPWQQYQMGRQQEADKEKDDQRRIESWDGSKTAMAPMAREGTEMREQLGNARALTGQLDQLKVKVKDLGFLDRTFPSWSDKQQAVAGELDVILAPMTQTLGAGTPQDREAARKLQAFSASIKQNPATAVKNIEAMQKYLQSHYESRFTSTSVPGSAADSGAQPAAKPQQAAGGDVRGRYERAIEKARAAGNDDLVKRLEAEMGAL